MTPIILLAFANDKSNGGSGYLRGLTSERNAIRDALMKAEENGLCQVLVEPDVTIDRIFDIFQNSNYRDRISIFHYGGHAESYALLLESASGGKVKAHSDGLVTFLSKQKSLKLVFLNGCSSKKQSEELVAAGLPAVIGTSQAINDNVATGLSSRFYKGVSAGMNIERAWTDAVDQIKTQNGADDTKSLYWEGILGSPGKQEFPWELYTGEGGEISKAWNLPEVANQPLFGLELPKSYYRKLPLTPYPGLRSFKREEAAIFFGRGMDIRKIHTQLGREQPVILVSGKKGVGKSSLFAAGLAPRFESEYAISHFNIQEKNLIDGLDNALNQIREEIGLEQVTPNIKSNVQEKIAEIEMSIPSASGFAKEILEKELKQLIHLDSKERLTYNEQWIAIEEKSGKPLVVLIDEIPDDPKTWRVFLEILFSIFEAKPAPKGKLILSIDEENRGAFCEMLHSAEFPYAEVFLQPLTWDGVNEAIVGNTISPFTKEYYRLQIENSASNNLPFVLTGDLLDGQPTLVAPFLQVQLTALWESAVDENPQAPVFTLKNYQQGILSGTIMDRFLTRQLNHLKEWNEEPVQSGLVLDLLYLHTSALGKSHLLEASARKQTYGDREDLVNDLTDKCKDLFLLTGSHSDATHLGHNLLALVVIRQYSISLNPGQEAARILNAKTGEKDQEGITSWLNEDDLETVEKGMSGMRSLTDKEKKLLEFSRLKKLKAQKERKRNRIIRGTLVTIVVIFALLAGWQWNRANHRYLYARAGELAFKAKEVTNEDNTLALNIARQAYSVLNSNSPPEVMQTLSEIFHSQEKMPFYAAKFQHKKMVNTAIFSPDGKNVLTASEDGFAILWDLKGNVIKTFPHGPEVFMASFSPNGQQILSKTLDHVYLWERDGTLTDTNSISESVTNLDSFSTDGMKIISNHLDDDNNIFRLNIDSLRQSNNIVIPSPAKNRVIVIQNGICTLYDKNGKVLKDSLSLTAINASFSREGDKFLTSSRLTDTCQISVWNIQGDSLYSFRCKGEIVNAVFSPDGKELLTASSDFTAKIWDFTDPFLHRFPKRSQAMNTVDFYPDGNRYLTASWDSTAKIWNESGLQIDILKHGDVVNSAFFASDGKHIITASRDSTARIWIPNESKVIILKHGAEVTCALFSHDGKFALTSSLDSLVRLWTLDGLLVKSFHMQGEVSRAVFSPDDAKILSVSSDSVATLLDINRSSSHAFKHPASVTSAEFSPDGKNVVTTCIDSLVRQWTADGELIHTFKHFEKPKIAFFTADGHHMITGGKTVKIWSISGMLQDSLVHTAYVSSIKVSPDNQLILTTCLDHNAYLWNFKGDLIARYESHTAKINSGFFTQDGHHVLTAADDGYILRWRIPQAIFASLKTAAIDQLSKQDKELYGFRRWNSPKALFANFKGQSSKKEEVQ